MSDLRRVPGALMRGGRRVVWLAGRRAGDRRTVLPRWLEELATDVVVVVAGVALSSLVFLAVTGRLGHAAPQIGGVIDVRQAPPVDAPFLIDITPPAPGSEPMTAPDGSTPFRYAPR